ncbi:hypothetical protein BDZ89DRAFT_1150115 [Hymenopellis radicata]|nr:hypothetical protein BDZ89DRAFT_1150115 [Hymenopellis radicata]
MSDDIALAQSILNELLRAFESRDVQAATTSLKRIRDEIKYTPEMRPKKLSHSLVCTVKQGPIKFPDNETIATICSSLAGKLYADERQAKLDLIEDWWTIPDVPTTNPSTITFKDTTGDEEDWGSCDVQTSLDEPFRLAFKRFRVQQNQKYRHPFLPCLDFVLYNLGVTDNFTDVACKSDVTVRDVLASHGDETVFPFLRNSFNLHASQHSCIVFQRPWERVLPSWFPPTPSTWLTPSIPPAYRHLDALKADSASFRSYLKVPLLNFAGTGKEILPSMKTPPLVVSDVYLPVTFSPYGPPYLSNFDIDFDHVRPQDKLVPPLTTEQVLPLLGRVIEFSIAPLDPASKGTSKEARKKRRKLYKDLGIDDRLHNFIAIPWGWDPSTACLYCLHISVDTVLILDISKPRSFAPVNVCQWLGVASLPEDQWALEQDGNAPAPAASAGSAKVDYGKHLQAIVDRLNQTSEHHIFEVKNDSDILIGDTHLSKEHLNFEIVLKNIALGVWMSTSNDDNEDTLSVTMQWVAEGSVNWTNPSPVAHQDESGGEWESLGVCSVDSGSLIAIAEDAIDSEPLTIEGGVPPASILELLSDLCSVDDGGYSVHIKRNSDNRVAAIKIKTYEGEGEDEDDVASSKTATAGGLSSTSMSSSSKGAAARRALALLVIPSQIGVQLFDPNIEALKESSGQE